MLYCYVDKRNFFSKSVNALREFEEASTLIQGIEQMGFI